MLWSIVKSNSKNVVAWHPLISTWRYLINQKEKDYDIAKIRNVYEEYLADFPVCYVHWIKYVEHEVRVGAVENVSKVYGKALLWLSYSVEIWIHYCKFAVDREGEPNTIRKFFEQALDYVGTDFRSAELWSKYIEYESSQNDLSRTINIYTRVLQYPIQHLETFFKEFKDMVAKHDLPETHLAIGQSLYAKAKEIGSKIIAFERVIKTPYFKVDPLDDAELETWHNYLDFIEGEGDQNKVVKLYERCVIVCANYPQYWLRYVLKMETSGLVEHSASAFRRATLMFLDIQSDEQLFTAPFRDSEVAPLLLEAVTKHANMVSGNVDKARKILGETLDHVQPSRPLMEALIHFETIQPAPRKIDYLQAYVEKGIKPNADNENIASSTEREELSLIYTKLLRLVGDELSLKKAEDLEKSFL